jgi:hypothetical protein
MVPEYAVLGGGHGQFIVIQVTTGAGGHEFGAGVVVVGAGVVVVVGAGVVVVVVGAGVVVVVVGAGVVVVVVGAGVVVDSHDGIEYVNSKPADCTLLSDIKEIFA